VVATFVEVCQNQHNLVFADGHPRIVAATHSNRPTRLGDGRPRADVRLSGSATRAGDESDRVQRGSAWRGAHALDQILNSSLLACFKVQQSRHRGSMVIRTIC